MGTVGAPVLSCALRFFRFSFSLKIVVVSCLVWLCVPRFEVVGVVSERSVLWLTFFCRMLLYIFCVYCGGMPCGVFLNGVLVDVVAGSVVEYFGFGKLCKLLGSGLEYLDSGFVTLWSLFGLRCDGLAGQRRGVFFEV